MNGMITGTIETLDNIESLLNVNLSDLAALPDLKVPPLGRYKLAVTTKTSSDDAQHPALSIWYEVLECLEQVNADDIPAKVGDTFSVQYTIDNKWGLGKLQKGLQVYSMYFNQENIGEIVSLIEGIQINGTVKRREDKKTLDDDGNPRIYGSVVNIEIL
jgi:hypothetical protein